MHIDTKCIHAGGYPDTQTKGINTPIFTSSVHEYLDTEVLLYQRYFNTPTQEAVAKKICELEGAEEGIIFSSGMAAISTVLLTLLNSGDHAVIQEEIYGGSYAFIEELFKRLGISFTFVSTDAQVKLIKPALSLGGIETTICDPATTSHRKVSSEVRKHLGISDNLLRLSVCIEHQEDLIEDIQQAMENK